MYIDVSDDVFKDTLINDWMGSNVILEASIPIMKEIIQKPINDINELQYRQNALNISDVSCPLEYIHETENDVIWGLTLQDKAAEDAERTMMSMLFPSEFYSSWISYINPILELYHGYKIYSLPIISILNPISIVLAPYFYLTKTMKLGLNIKKYLRLLWDILRTALNSMNDFKMVLTKWITAAIYITIYLYSIYQTFDISIALHKFRETLLKRINGIAAFTRTAHAIIGITSDHDWMPYTRSTYDPTFVVAGNLSDAYCLWTNAWNYRTRLQNLLNCVCAIDVSNTISRLYHNHNWCKVEYRNDDGFQLWDMKNPLLNDKQVGNPAYLGKNIIITGPNAAGKTTYVKSIVLNAVLAQTIGITMAKRAIIKPFDIISTFMRVHDIVGTRSFYEAEAEYCKTMLDKASQHNDKNILFVMDEPMHSTPPTEGFATAYAVCKHLGTEHKHCKLIITTHYHNMVYLQRDYPNNFINLSVEAIELPNNRFKFPYKIHNTYSFQCIAIELLEDKVFPSDVIQTAIKIKNKISNHELNN